MNAYDELIKSIKCVLDNCTAYRVSKDLNINARTINRYQNGTSPIENMSLETAGKIYNYYTKNKERLEMKNYDLRNYGYGVGSVIQVENEVIEELARFYNWKEDMIQRHIESDVVEVLEELEEDGKHEESISFAKEDDVTGTYEAIEFEATINKKGDDVTVVVK